MTDEYIISHGAGLNICFLGPDGVGKGTVISILIRRHNAQYFHLKPRKKRGPTTENHHTAPHSLPQYSRLKTLVKLIYLFLEYQVFWYINCIMLRDKERFCIFDRYIDDILVDPKRFRLKGNTLIRKIVVKYLPKPDIYFILNASAQEIYRRKHELNLKEIERQIKEYNLMIDGRRYIKINAERPVEEIIEEVYKYINKFNRENKL